MSLLAGAMGISRERYMFFHLNSQKPYPVFAEHSSEKFASTLVDGFNIENILRVYFILRTRLALNPQLNRFVFQFQSIAAKDCLKSQLASAHPRSYRDVSWSMADR